MYKILGFSGGVYRFDEVVEFVEDAGGIILKRDEFHISRGAYFISEEIHVIILIPEEAFEELDEIVKEVKGDLEVLEEIEEEYNTAIISLIPVYNLLSRSGTWVELDTLEDMMECPCLNGICVQLEAGSCSVNLQKTLDNMCKMEIAETKEESNKQKYRLKQD